MAGGGAAPARRRGQGAGRPFRHPRSGARRIAARLPGGSGARPRRVGGGQALGALPPGAGRGLQRHRALRGGAAPRLRRRAVRLGLGLAVSRRRAAPRLPGRAGGAGPLASRRRGSRRGAAAQPAPPLRFRRISIMTEKLKVALAGAGMISHYHLLAWSRLAEEVSLVAICDPDLARARHRAGEFGIAAAYATAEEMLAGEAIDALDIASPRETHAALVELAAERGIDVLCQKPLTPTLDEATALVRRLGGTTRLMVHENWRFRPWYRQLASWLRAGEL